MADPHRLVLRGHPAADHVVRDLLGHDRHRVVGIDGYQEHHEVALEDSLDRKQRHRQAFPSWPARSGHAQA